MARRRHHTKNPVAARQRKMVVQSIAFTLLVGAAVCMVFLAVTSG